MQKLSLEKLLYLLQGGYRLRDRKEHPGVDHPWVFEQVEGPAAGFRFHSPGQGPGVGIEDIEKAMEPLYTTCTTGERSGLGFAVMEAFMDKVKVRSQVGRGTTVTLEKTILSKGAE